MNNKLYYKIEFLHETFERRNKDNSISRGQGRVLTVLKRNGKIKTKELAEILNIRITSLNETLRKLENKGYIEKVRSKYDRRVSIVRITDKGREVELNENTDIDVFDCLSDDEKNAFDEYLSRVILEYENKLKESDPINYDMIKNHRNQLFEKYFGYGSDEWYKLYDD